MKKYKTNPTVEFIPLDVSEQVIHNIDSGDIHYVDDISTNILDLLSSPISADELIDKLLEIFDGDHEKICADTLEFLEEMTAKNVVLVTDDEK